MVGIRFFLADAARHVPRPAIFVTMMRFLAALVVVFFFQGDRFAEGRAAESLDTEFPVYCFVHTATSRFPEPAEEKYQLQQVFVSLNWTRFDSDPGDLNPPKLFRGGIYLAQPPFAGSRGRGSIGRRFLANIDRQSNYWSNFEMTYRQAVEQTGSVTKIGEIEVNYFVDRPTSYFIPDRHNATLMAVHLMALFRRELIDDGVVLLGTIETDGRIGPVFSMLSKKVALLIPLARQILIPAGQLTSLDSIVMHQIQQHGTRVLEVDNLEQAYQLMVRR